MTRPSHTDCLATRCKNIEVGKQWYALHACYIKNLWLRVTTVVETLYQSGSVSLALKWRHHQHLTVSNLVMHNRFKQTIPEETVKLHMRLSMQRQDSANEYSMTDSSYNYISG
jgi:hypothetical protein